MMKCFHRLGNSSTVNAEQVIFGHIYCIIIHEKVFDGYLNINNCLGNIFEYQVITSCEIEQTKNWNWNCLDCLIFKKLISSGMFWKFSHMYKYYVMQAL